MSAYTPGPWRIANGEDRRVYLINHGRDAVGETVYTDTRNPADARLIAAAPDLLAALQSLINDQRDASLPILSQARAAIAKATGQE